MELSRELSAPSIHHLESLHQVTLTVTTTEFRFIEASPVASPVNFTWSANGNVSVSLYSVLNNTFYPVLLHEPVGGSGSGTIGVDGLFQGITLTGSRTFGLDPSFFVGDHALNPWSPFAPDISVSESDAGMWYGGDMLFSSGQPSDVQQHLGCGPSNNFPQEWCDQTDYILTYYYTPLPSVPEPATWATMLLGFGALGAHRRWERRRTRSAA